MKGYVRQGHRYYAVLYESCDPVTGKEPRAWHPLSLIERPPVHVTDSPNPLLDKAG
jgi:hypothetical protein